jgi:hypothetical protein
VLTENNSNVYAEIYCVCPEHQLIFDGMRKSNKQVQKKQAAWREYIHASNGNQLPSNPLKVGRIFSIDE